MKNITKFLSTYVGVSGLTLGSCLGWVQAVQAETANTVPEGYITYTMPAGTIASPKITVFSVPLKKVATDIDGIAAGKVTGFTTNTLTSTGAGWTSGTLAAAGASYFVRIKNGDAQGAIYLVSANTADTLTVSSVDLTTLNLASSGGSQSTFEIFPGDTLWTLFGAGTVDGANGTIKGAAVEGDADYISLHDGSGWKSYWYSTTNNRWQQSTVDKNNLVLMPTWGLRYFRRAGSALAMTFPGVVSDSNTVVSVNNTGLTFFNLLFPVDRTLLNTGIHQKPGFVVNSGTPSLADRVYLWNGVGWVYYTYNQSLGQWRDGSTSTDRNNLNIPAGTPIWFQKTTGAAGSQTWSFPTPYTL